MHKVRFDRNGHLYIPPENGYNQINTGDTASISAQRFSGVFICGGGAPGSETDNPAAPVFLSPSGRRRAGTVPLMLIEYGNTRVRPDWVLNEEAPTGYSRIYYIISGDLTYESADVKRPMRPGCLYALPSTAPYHVERDPDTDFVCTYMHVVFGGYRVTGLIELEVGEGSCLEALVLTVRQAIRERRIELVERLSEDFAFFLKGDEHFAQNSRMLTRVQQHILGHISEELTIEGLSRLFNYHPNYFIRLFRSETGYTPYQYIVQQRMQYAVTQLNLGLPNDEVCYACGYTDSSTFTRAFRKYYGVAPQKYRKGFRKP